MLSGRCNGGGSSRTRSPARWTDGARIDASPHCAGRVSVPVGLLAVVVMSLAVVWFSGYLPAVSIAIGVAGCLVLTLVAPWWPLVLIPWLTVLWVPVATFHVGRSFTVTGMDVAMGLLTVSMALSASGILRRVPRRPKGFAVAMLALAFWPLLTASLGELTSFGPTRLVQGVLIYVRRWGEFAVLPLAALFLLPRSRVGLVVGSALGAGIVAVVAVLSPPVQMLVVGALGREELAIGGFGLRQAGTMFNPNIMGTWLVMYLNVALAVTLAGQVTTRRSAVGVVLAVATLSGMIMTGARGVALLGGTATMLFWGFRKTRDRWRGAAVVACCAIGVVLLVMAAGSETSNELLVRVVSVDWEQRNVYARFYNQAVGLGIAATYPLGVGIQNVGNVPGYALMEGIGTTDNLWLDLLAETGAAGLIGAMLLMGLMWRRQRGRQDGMAVAARASIVVCVATSFAYASLAFPQTSALFWLVIALAEVAHTGRSTSVQLEA